MRAAVASCEALLRRATDGAGGHVVKTTGDGLMAVFADAGGGVTAAIEAQRELAGASWPLPIGVRMGLHTGTAHPDEGDYHAPAVNRAARIAATAHPGQVLLSEATAALTEEVGLRDLGEHRLRGLAPMRLFQVLHPDLRGEFPPTATTALLGLPTPTTSFVGRAAALESIGRLVGEHRAVTLTGTGGCGKTRLAVEVARSLANQFPDGVRFVDLAAVTDEGAVDDAVVDGLGLAASLGTTEPRTRVVSHLSNRELLVVLDNCEHLLDGCADLVDAVLAASGSSRLLVTSREPLGLPGERVVVVPSLDAESEAVQLFADRAQTVRAGFALDERTKPAVTQICRRLDGIPLAIELAAARTSHLAPLQMLERLDDRFRLLTGGRRRIQRQQTLAAALDWSYDLLDADDREVLQALAVFPAAFSLEAAEAVVTRPDAVERLGSLVTKSLLQVVDDRHGVRYRLLETVRLYAEDKLVEAGDAASCRARHCAWVHDWLEAKPLEERWLGDDDLLASDLPNVRAALEWSFGNDDLEVTARIAAGVDWSRTEAWSDGDRWCERLSEVADLPAQLRIQLLLMVWWLGPLSRSRGDWGTRIVELASEHPGPLLPLAHAALARDQIVVARDMGDPTFLDRAVESVDTAVALSSESARPLQMYCRMLAAMVHSSRLDVSTASMHLDAATREPPEDAYRGLHAALRAYLAITAFVGGDAQHAVELAGEVYSPGALVPYWQHPRALCLVALGATGDLATADQAFRDYFEASRGLDWVYADESVLVLGGVLAGMREDWSTASRLLAAGSMAMNRTPADYLLYATFRDRARQHLGPEPSRRLRADGLAMPIEAALALALDR
jgi:predicted ATPase